jgi:hypothetical protein
MRRLQLDGFTNMINVHTNSICCVDLISVSIVVMHGEIVEVPVMWYVAPKSVYQLLSKPEDDAAAAIRGSGT